MKELKNICGGKLYPSVDTSNDIEMTGKFLRVPFLRINHHEFKKTKQEKLDLKKVHNNRTPKQVIMRAGSFPDTSQIGKLVVYLENVEKTPDFKTTRCYRGVRKNQVDSILFNLTERNYKIKKFHFNF